MIELVRGDITEQDVDAIVNAANSTCSAAAASTARSTAPAARRSSSECRRARRLRDRRREGDRPGDLPARCVIHTVGPVWHGGGAARRSCSPRVTGARSRSPRARLPDGRVPGDLGGVYGYPVARAAAIATAAVRGARRRLRADPFVLFGDETYAAFTSSLASR